MRPNVRLVPDLVDVDVGAVTCGHSLGETTEIAHVVRRGEGVAGVLRLDSPGRRAIQKQHDAQIVGVGGVDGGLEYFPILAPTLRLDLVPGRAQSHPGHAVLGHPADDVGYLLGI